MRGRQGCGEVAGRSFGERPLGWEGFAFDVSAGKWQVHRREYFVEPGGGRIKQKIGGVSQDAPA